MKYFVTGTDTGVLADKTTGKICRVVPRKHRCGAASGGLGHVAAGVAVAELQGATIAKGGGGARGKIHRSQGDDDLVRSTIG